MNPDCFLIYCHNSNFNSIKVQFELQLLITAKAEITADTIAKLQQAGITMEQQPESAEEEVTDEGEADTASPEAAQAE